MMDSKDKIEHNIHYLTKRKDTFSKEYVSARKKEGRVLNDTEVQNLPETDSTNKNHAEWKLRKKSSQRILDYLKKRNEKYAVLDIGCGNGWFAHQMASHPLANVDGLDINSEELTQASRVFKNKNLQFMYADLFEAAHVFNSKYDIITLNASIQYFEDLEKLLSTLKSFLKPMGEIHILDSPFYQPNDIEAAKKRTLEYYKNLGVPEMSNYYFHHSISILKSATILYSPKKGIFNKLSFTKDVPFYWLKIN